MGFWEILKGEEPDFLEALEFYENTGQLGEFYTEYALTNNNLVGELVVLKNLYVPVKGRTTEVDLLMVHEKGLFVFESKNLDGWIFGDKEQLNWTQCLKNGEKYRFYNPIRQNRTHISALAEYMNMPISAFTSCIIFSERCSLKKVPQSCSEFIIVRRPNMLGELRIILNNSAIKYSSSQIQSMVAKLSQLSNKGNDEKKQHIEDIQTKCKFCGRALVLRNGKYGRFWGCSGYPNCRFTMPF